MTASGKTDPVQVQKDFETRLRKACLPSFEESLSDTAFLLTIGSFLLQVELSIG